VRSRTMKVRAARADAPDCRIDGKRGMGRGVGDRFSRRTDACAVEMHGPREGSRSCGTRAS
jgi:hypothetical protein